MKEYIEKRLSSDQVFDGRIIKVYHDEIEQPNGRHSHRERVEHVGGVSILAVKDDCIYFVKQYRYCIGRRIVEIPAGLIDPGESPERAAARELREEIGLRPVHLTHVCNMQPSPGFLNEPHTIYFADELVEDPLPQDEGENIEVLKLPVRTVRMLYKRGYFEDAKTICALGYYFSHMID